MKKTAVIVIFPEGITPVMATEKKVTGIRCNNCNKRWSSDEELPQVKLADGEVVKGCDHCSTDESLMDIFDPDYGDSVIYQP